MTCPVSIPIVCGKSFSDSQSCLDLMSPPPDSRQARSSEPATTNPLERLAQLVHSNDVLIADLANSRARIVAALVYLDTPDGNARFGSAHLQRCRDRHKGILAQLRANRIEALHLLGHQAKSAG